MKRILFSAIALLLGTVAGCGSSSTTTDMSSGGVCAKVTCPMNQACDTTAGTCKVVSACAGVSCSAGQVCDGAASSATAGMCVTETCGISQCGNGQVCNQTTLACVNPGIPALSAQIDRMGRPAINTALTNPFDLYPAGPVGVNTSGNLNASESGDMTKVTYNADATPANWATNWAAAFAQNMAVLDGLDGTCGNQFAYAFNPGTGVIPGYGFLSAFLAADVLLVDTRQTICTQYLAVEGQATGIVTNTDCGGRKLDYDVIDVTYSVMAKTALSGVMDNIAQSTAPGTTFPFFAAPK